MNPPFPPELRALREILVECDPAPPSVAEGGYAAPEVAGEWRNSDSVPLELVSDSADMPSPTRFVSRPVRLRPRVLTFMTPGRIVEVELVTTLPRLMQASGIVISRAGQGVPEGHLVIRHPAGERNGELDRHGAFQIDDLPRGPLSVVFRPAGGTPAIADWIVG